MHIWDFQIWPKYIYFELKGNTFSTYVLKPKEKGLFLSPMVDLEGAGLFTDNKFRLGKFVRV